MRLYLLDPKHIGSAVVSQVYNHRSMLSRPLFWF
jgi:hypothetical protein